MQTGRINYLHLSPPHPVAKKVQHGKKVSNVLMLQGLKSTTPCGISKDWTALWCESCEPGAAVVLLMQI